MRACFCELLYLMIYCSENDSAILELHKVKILCYFLSMCIMCKISAV